MLPSYKRHIKKALWLIPGLTIKRWIGVAAIGFMVLALGLALSFNLQPFTLLIRMLQTIALVVPSSISGPGAVGIGLILVYLGTVNTSKTFLNVMEDTMGTAHGSFLEALYRKRKLSHGPRIVAIGGGTGLSTLLLGLKRYTNNITAIVTVGDDGGSSGRLRKEQGIIPPGDIRNCIAALADEEKLITELFQYRFQNGNGLEGHSFGNLFLTAMCRITGDMMSAIKESSKVLNIRGRVLPSTLENISLSAQLSDGTVVHGESEIPEMVKKTNGQIVRILSTPEAAKPLPEAIKAIEDAELIVLGPGSLYTSIIPNLLIKDIAQAVSESAAPKVYVANIMTQPGETDGFSISDHVGALLKHVYSFEEEAAYPEQSLVTTILANQGLPEALLEKYKAAHYTPVTIDTKVCREKYGVSIVQHPLLDQSQSKICHHPKRLAKAIIRWYKQNAPQPYGLAQSPTEAVIPHENASATVVVPLDQHEHAC